jgi:hypothetical protein
MEARKKQRVDVQPPYFCHWCVTGKDV